VKRRIGHVEIALNETTKISVTNANTKNKTKESGNAAFKGTIASVKLEIFCKTVVGAGALTNSEPQAKVMPSKARRGTRIKPLVESCKLAANHGSGWRRMHLIQQTTPPIWQETSFSDWKKHTSNSLDWLVNQPHTYLWVATTRNRHHRRD
jgi:hypothetical protein